MWVALAQQHGHYTGTPRTASRSAALILLEDDGDGQVKQGEGGGTNMGRGTGVGQRETPTPRTLLPLATTADPSRHHSGYLLWYVSYHTHKLLGGQAGGGIRLGHCKKRRHGKKGRECQGFVWESH